jgi:signal transduction histidine kinase
MPRFHALGLRGRIVGAVLLTTVATLTVAAFTVLRPLENKLKSAERRAFETQVGTRATEQFAPLDLTKLLLVKLRPGKVASSAEALDIKKEHQLVADGKVAEERLKHAEQVLATVSGATEVDVVGLPGPTGQPRLSVQYPTDVDLGGPNLIDDAIQQFRSRAVKPLYTFRTIGGVQYIRAAVLFTTPPISGTKIAPRWVLLVRKRFASQVADAVHAVRTAFIDASIAALALVLLLAIPLAATIVSRLRRLRHAALQLAEHGPNVEIPVIRAHDEVGDLARTLALMQTQLHNQEEARRAFVATASHELRTPLTSLEGILELVEEDLAGPDPDLEDARSLLRRSRAQARRLSRLAADLLDLSRIDAQVQLRSEPLELGELARAVMAEFELGTGERQIRCELHDSGKPLWALGDPGSVARILRILLDNAVRVSESRSEIVVELHRGDQACLSVCDEGPGVAPEERDLIFERFQRGRSTSGQAGFGLGLAIGRELAHRMGGDLVLEDHDRPGAKFTLRLPIAVAPQHDPLSVV